MPPNALENTWHYAKLASAALNLAAYLSLHLANFLTSERFATY